MPDDILEVKTDAEPAEDAVLDEDGLKKLAGEEEKETPTLTSGEEKPAEEAETPAAEEPAEEKPDSESDAETPGEEAANLEPVAEPPPGPKPVEGETPRERALRLEIQRLREINRSNRSKKLLGDVQPLSPEGPAELSLEDKKALEVYDPEQVSNMEKLLPVLAKKLGFVRKDTLHQETYQSTSQEVLDTWLEAHPDYLPENDKGDILYSRLKAEVALYQKPKNPKDWVKILNRAHNEIMGITAKPKVSAAQIQAQQEKIKVASHGPASVAPKKASASTVSKSDQELRALAERGALKGFSKEEMDEMFGG